MPSPARNIRFKTENFREGERKGLQAMPRLIDIHAERKKLQRLVGNFRTVHLLVGKIPPTPDGLSKQKSDDDTIAHAEKIDFFDDTNDSNTRDTA